MKRLVIILALTAALALSACSPAPARQTLEPTQAGGSTASPTDGYPVPTPAPLEGAYPGQALPQEGTMNQLWMAYPPVPGDEAMERASFFVDAATLTPGSIPGTFDLSLEGNLPTGCNLPRVVVNPPDANNVIQVEAYSVRPTDMACAEVLLPYAGKVATIAGFPAGTYSVMVNGEVSAGEVTLP